MKFNILTKEFLRQKYLTEKLSMPKIGKLVGCSDMSIFKYLKKYNIPRRTLSEAMKGKKRKPFSEATKKKMSEVKRGSGNSNWKGGRKKDGDGYIYIYSPNHPYKIRGNYIFEHRLVVERYLGRYLLPTEVVHHINGIKDDNRIGNLVCFKNKSAHNRFHKNPNSVNSNEIVFDGRLLKNEKVK